MTGERPVLSRDPAVLPAELPRGSELPEDHDPLAAGVLMKHQVEWIEDESDLKGAEKGRRTGITYAEALDDTLLAAKKRSEGGQNVFYIGDTKDKGREFIGYVAHFAKIVAGELAQVEEFLFQDQREDGSSKFISAFRVRFASGCRVEALSSRPENIRGLQGAVVIDEAAYHQNVRAVLDSVGALLIWGGKVRIISTHNGVLNPFNELIRESKARKAAGEVTFNWHFIPFSTAVENGLYERVCLIAGKTPTPEGKVAWEAKIRAPYGSRTAAMHQELDAIPAEAEGAALTRVQIEACMETGAPIVRWSLPDEFKNYPEHVRKAEAATFCREQLLPILERLDPKRPHYLGQDFARSGDGSVVVVGNTDAILTRRMQLILEMHNVPFDTQRDVLYFIGDHLPRFSGAALDATGNGAYLAEKAVQRWGERAIEVKFSSEWYRVNMPPYIEAFADKTIVLPRDEDVLKDHQSLAYVGGVIKVPDDMRFKGLDGLERHGDTAIAGALMWHASQLGPVEYGYQPASEATDGGVADWLFPEAQGSERAIW
ncbi:hypothetical protein [Methylosinus sp. Sm6]|uniref:hypothetical protein n=1 Tax=Methylosinus sp. Sm6 TaxID=2866948 RepID=UPI001C996F69|nr:hypothetical protein [Methylosinus sp. Sm6]MBY6243863.1 hypothetical protein [Methylosinus sp. Sm6]